MLAVSVAINLLSTAIWEFAIAPLYRGDLPLQARPSGRGKGTLDAALRVAASELSEATRGSGVDRKHWERFLLSSDVGVLVGDIFTFRMDDADPSLHDIEVAFAGLWSSFLDDNQLTSPLTASTLFDTLTGVCNNVLDAAIKAQVLSAFEAKASARHRVVLARLDALDAREVGPTSITDNELTEFEFELRAAVGARHSTIEPPNIFEKQRVPIDQLYIAPLFGGPVLGERGVDLPHLLAGLSRRVVLGHPGAGKSTLTTKLCADLAAPHRDTSVLGRRFTPWVIELRKYVAAKDQHSLSLLGYFALWAETSYLLTVPQSAFARLLERGQLLVMFDGLDELVDTSRRVEIRDEIDSFCRRFPRSPVLVTSRRVGYDQAPLDPDVFDVVHLLDFDDTQVADYADRWFTYQLSAEPTIDREERVADFLTESEVASDLRRSPLLLALLCSSYRGAGYIPKNLPDVYDSCATLLFSTWDKQRHIEVLLPFA